MSFDADRTKLVKAPRVRCVVRKTYIVDWSWMGDGYERDTGAHGLEECRHVKSFMTRSAAYRHAAAGWILNRKAARGCTRDKCARGNGHVRHRVR